jgi:beta-glucosidase
LADGKITVKVDITNSGKRDGDEVVQLYVKHLDSAVERPIKELKGFRRIPVKAGATKTVSLELKGSDLKHWDATKRQWVLEAGPVQLMIGASSRDIRLSQTIQAK